MSRYSIASQREGENSRMLLVVAGCRGRWQFDLSQGANGYEKFKGLHGSTCLLHLKESEFRYNHPKETLYQLILRIIRNKPLF